MSNNHTVWYVTPITNPSKKLEGPYQTQEEAQMVCIAATSDEYKAKVISLILEGRPLSSVTPTSFIPRPFDASSIPTPLILRNATGHAVSAAPKQLSSSDLLDKLRALSKHKLLTIAKAISLDVPSSLEHNKAALATRLYSELTKQAKS